MTIGNEITLKFKAFDYRLLDKEVARIYEVVKKTNASVTGPIPMPKKIEKLTVNRSPHVDKESREQFEIRTFRRNMIITPSANTIDALMKVELAPGVEVEIKVAKGGQV